MQPLISSFQRSVDSVTVNRAGDTAQLRTSHSVQIRAVLATNENY